MSGDELRDRARKVDTGGGDYHETNVVLDADKTIGEVGFRLYNAAVIWALRTAFHPFVSKDTMLISFEGRASKKWFTTPVAFVWDRDQVTCFTRRPWWKNLQGGAEVVVWIRGMDYKGVAETVHDDPATVAEALRAFVEKVPQNRKFYQMVFDGNERPNPQAIDRVAHDAALIRVRLAER